MPVEIKELIIRAVAEEPGQAAGKAGDPLCPGGDQQAIIDACVKQTLRILKKAKER